MANANKQCSHIVQWSGATNIIIIAYCPVLRISSSSPGVQFAVCHRHSLKTRIMVASLCVRAYCSTTTKGGSPYKIFLFYETRHTSSFSFSYSKFHGIRSSPYFIRTIYHIQCDRRTSNESFRTQK